MNTKKKSIGLYVIASAIIWGAVIMGCSLKLKGTECYNEITYILASGAIFHLLFLWGPLAIQFRKAKKEE
jgi:hypothetical protein